jgi:hypothetical protein
MHLMVRPPAGPFAQLPLGGVGVRPPAGGGVGVRVLQQVLLEVERKGARMSTTAATGNRCRGSGVVVQALGTAG